MSAHLDGDGHNCYFETNPADMSGCYEDGNFTAAVLVDDVGGNLETQDIDQDCIKKEDGMERLETFEGTQSLTM